MIQTAKTYREANPGTALELVPLKLACGHEKIFVASIAALKREGCELICTTPDCGGPLPDLAAIPVCTEAGEVGEMCEHMCVCVTCGNLPSAGGACPCNALRPVTHRIFAWGGEEVDWAKELWEPEAVGAYGPAQAGDQSIPESEAPRLLTVVLVGENHITAKSRDPNFEISVKEQAEWEVWADSYAEAAAACAEAGVEFVTPGGRMEL